MATKDACYSKVKARYKVFLLLMRLEQLLSVERLEQVTGVINQLKEKRAVLLEQTAAVLFFLNTVVEK